MTLSELFPDGDYKFALRFERDEPANYFAPTRERGKILGERKHWLRTAPQTYAALRPEGETLLAEAVELAQSWNGIRLSVGAESPWEKCLALGEAWEVDYLLLKADPDGEIRLHGGCLCFPSFWRLTDKIGHPIEFIHGPVPGLNASLGSAIHKILGALKPGVASLRYNWGLARSPELNLHPDRGLPRLDATVTADEVWLRVEHQALVALPKSGGILFAIRVINHPLAEVKADVVGAARLGRALKTMAEPLAQYKGIASARSRILELLRA